MYFRSECTFTFHVSNVDRFYAKILSCVRFIDRQSRSLVRLRVERISTLFARERERFQGASNTAGQGGQDETTRGRGNRFVATNPTLRTSKEFTRSGRESRKQKE